MARSSPVASAGGAGHRRRRSGSWRRRTCRAWACPASPGGTASDRTLRPSSTSRRVGLSIVTACIRTARWATDHHANTSRKPAKPRQAFRGQQHIFVTRFAGEQLAVTGTAGLMKAYVASAGRWRHGPRIRDRYGYRQFTDLGIAFRLRSPTGGATTALAAAHRRRQPAVNHFVRLDTHRATEHRRSRHTHGVRSRVRWRPVAVPCLAP